MKYLKTLGLATVAAAALMAFVGAGTASATYLTSPSGTKLPTDTTIHANLTAGTTATLETLGGEVLDTCTAATIHVTTTNAGSETETVSGEIKALTWGTAATPCSKTTTTTKLGKLEIHTEGASSNGNGTLTAKETEVTVNTIFGTCTFAAPATGLDLGQLKGGSPATIAINAIVPRVSGLCPSEARWTASYTVDTPNPLFVD